MVRRREKDTPLLCMRGEATPGEPECDHRATVVVDRADGKTFALCHSCYTELRGPLFKKQYLV